MWIQEWLQADERIVNDEGMAAQPVWSLRHPGKISSTALLAVGKDLRPLTLRLVVVILFITHTMHLLVVVARLRFGFWACMLLGLGCGCLDLAADERVVVADRDTTLFSNGTGEANMGAFTNGMVGTTAVGARTRFLVRFPTEASVPSGAKVTRVRFVWSVIKQNSTAPSAQWQWHRMLKPWVEGRGTGDLGSTSLAGEPTWVWREFGTVRWGVSGGQPGVDFVNTPSANFMVSSEGRLTCESDATVHPGLRADVQGWVDGTLENHGWILLCSDESARRSARRVGTHESIPEERPELVVEYEVVTPGEILLKEMQFREGRLMFQFDAEGGKTYVLEHVAKWGEAWQQDAVFPAGESRTVDVSVDTAGSEARFLRIRTVD